MKVSIDGQEYVKASTVGSSIGIGITTHNRPNTCSKSVARILEHTPNARIVLVDDASQHDINIDGVEVYKFNTNVGIAKAKNKCLELLRDCEHIFLFDDDTYPITDSWYQPYIDSDEPHLMYLFENWASGRPVGDDAIVYTDGKIASHKHARGCMIYVESRVLDIVGGMDIRYGKAMNEHLDWSNRIYNAGLTTFPYMDVVNSGDLIHSMDEHQEVRSSINKIDRRFLIQANDALLEASKTSSKFAAYGKDVVIACYFVGVPDQQRNGESWVADESAIDKLRISVEAKGYEFILIHNCFDDLPNRTTISKSPYFERWLKEWQYLRSHPEINNVFVVDATDVDMLNDPFPDIEPNKLYVGDEPEILGCQWMIDNSPNHASYFIKNNREQLLNCGVVGGSRSMVMELLEDMYRFGINKANEPLDMGAFNYLLRTKYAGRFEHGRKVTTLFKSYEPSSSAWWRHK